MSRLMLKKSIEACGREGLRLEGIDVARVSRTGGIVTMRHVWDESTDGRVWQAVIGAARCLAQEMADRTGCAVEIYSYDGWVIDSIEAAEGPL